MQKEKIFTFLKALGENVPEDKPENRGKVFEFTCPLCGGNVKGVRFEYNGHVHAQCEGCNMKVME